MCLHAGVPDVKLTGLHSEVTVRCVPLGSQKYRCTYMPSIPGNLYHLAGVLLSLNWFYYCRVFCRSLHRASLVAYRFVTRVVARLCYYLRACCEQVSFLAASVCVCVC